MPTKNTAIMPSRLHLSASQPAGQREQAEGEEAGRRVFQQIAVAQAPFAGQRQRRDGREDQREHVIEKVADVQEQKVDAIAIHACLIVVRLQASLVRIAPSCQFSSRFMPKIIGIQTATDARDAPRPRSRSTNPRRLPEACRGRSPRCPRPSRTGPRSRRISHARDQLLYAVTGLMRVRTERESLDRAARSRGLSAGARRTFDRHARRCRR